MIGPRIAAQLIGVSLVRRRGRNIERDRIENLRLVVGGVTAGESFHRFQVRLNPRLMRDLVVIDVHHRQRVDVLAFAFCLGTSCLCLFNGGKAKRKIGSRNREVRIAQIRQRDAPIRDGASRIGLERLFVKFL